MSVSFTLVSWIAAHNVQEGRGIGVVGAEITLTLIAPKSRRKHTKHKLCKNVRNMAIWPREMGTLFNIFISSITKLLYSINKQSF